MKKFIFLASALVMMFATSCLSGDTDANSSGNNAQYKGSYVVTNLETGEKTTLEDVIVDVTITDNMKGIMDITFEGLSFVSGMPPKNITIPDVPITKTISESEIVKNFVFEAYNVIPEIGGVKYSQYPVSEIKGSIGVPVTIYFICKNTKTDIDYKVEFTTGESQGDNGEGTTPSAPLPTEYNGKYIVTNLNSDTPTEISGVSVGISIPDNNSQMLDVTFNKLYFAPGMPELSITLPNIPYTSSEVEFCFEAYDIVPMVNGTEFKQYNVSELHGNLGSPVNIWFKLESAKGTYHIEFVTE